MSSKKFLRNKPSTGGYKYKWSPTIDLPKDIEVRRTKRTEGRLSKEFCNATFLSNGVDNIVQYVFKNNGPNQHIAYVECDYVK